MTKLITLLEHSSEGERDLLEYITTHSDKRIAVEIDSYRQVREYQRQVINLLKKNGLIFKTAKWNSIFTHRNNEIVFVSKKDDLAFLGHPKVIKNL
jgi:hypothetical protein